MAERKEILGVFDAGSNHWAGDGFPVRKLFPSSGVDKQIETAGRRSSVSSS